jgi:MFS transporter, OFA family, oxalate/formate antiporter
MASDHLPNRWGIAVAAVIMQICLGAVYGWSVFGKTRAAMVRPSR